MFISFFLGVLIGTAIFTRLVRWILSMFKVQDPALSVATLVLFLALALVAGAFGNADGGPLNWERSLALILIGYLPAGILFLVIDLLAWRGRRAKT